MTSPGSPSSTEPRLPGVDRRPALVRLQVARGQPDRRRRGGRAAERTAAARPRARRGALRRGDARDLPGAARAAAGGRGLGRARDRGGRRLDGLRRARRSRPGARAAAPDAPGRSTCRSRTASLRFRWAEHAPAGAAGTVEVRPVGVEQSNSSVVFGEELILKAFRRVEPGVNPELELLRFLSAREFPHIAPLAGWYEVQARQIDATLGILQEYLAGAQRRLGARARRAVGRRRRAARPAPRARGRSRASCTPRSARTPTTRPSRPTSRAASRSRC